MTTRQLHKLRFFLTILQCLQASFIDSTHATPTYANQQSSYRNVYNVPSRNVVLMQNRVFSPSDLAADLKGGMQPRSTTSLRQNPGSSSTFETKQVSFLNLNSCVSLSCNRYNKPTRITHSTDAYQLELSAEQKTANPHKEEKIHLLANCRRYDLSRTHQQKKGKDTYRSSNNPCQPSPKSTKDAIRPASCTPNPDTDINCKHYLESARYLESAQDHTLTGYPQHANKTTQESQPTLLDITCSCDFCPYDINQRIAQLTFYSSTSATASRNDPGNTKSQTKLKTQDRGYISTATSRNDTDDANSHNSFGT